MVVGLELKLVSRSRKTHFHISRAHTSRALQICGINQRRLMQAVNRFSVDCTLPNFGCVFIAHSCWKSFIGHKYLWGTTN